MGRAELTAVSGGHGQAERKLMFERAHPEVMFGADGGRKWADVPVGGARARIRAERLEALLDQLDQLEADLAALARKFPGWAVTVNGLGHWYAQRREPIVSPWARYRPNLGADDPAGLRAALAAFVT